MSGAKVVATRSEDLSPLRRWTTFAAIMGPYLFYAYCWNTENFLRPYLADALALDRQHVSAFYSLQGFGALFGAVILSQIADRHGRRVTYAVVSVAFGFAALGSLLVTDYVTALVQRFAMGFFLGGVFGCAVSLYVGLFPPTVRGLLAGLVQLVYNGGDATLSWFGRHSAADDWQHVMVVGGTGAMITGIIAYLVIPDDRRILPWGEHTYSGAVPKAALEELFIAGRWKLTLRLAALCGLNFLAFQSFNGWLSTYLKDAHHLSADAVGRLLTAVHFGSMVGALIWGLAADRFGRRFNALAFVFAAVLIVVYILTPTVGTLLAATGFAYGFCFVASGVWGPYFAELYPDYLRATAASIFNWGRVVSLFGALLSGAIAQNYGLRPAMSVGAVVFACAALLWWSLPETLERRKPGLASA